MVHSVKASNQGAVYFFKCPIPQCLRNKGVEEMQLKAKAWRMLHPLTIKKQQQNSKHKTKASKTSNKHVHGIIHHWKLNYILWFVLTMWKVTNFPLRKCNWDIHELKYDTIFLLNWPNVFEHFICLGKLFQILGPVFRTVFSRNMWNW